MTSIKKEATGGAEFKPKSFALQFKAQALQAQLCRSVGPRQIIRGAAVCRFIGEEPRHLFLLCSVVGFAGMGWEFFCLFHKTNRKKG